MKSTEESHRRGGEIGPTAFGEERCYCGGFRGPRERLLEDNENCTEVD